MMMELTDDAGLLVPQPPPPRKTVSDVCETVEKKKPKVPVWFLSNRGNSYN